MTDIVDSATRSRMMAGIGTKNTVPEMLVRHALFAKGYRYRLNVKALPGHPDIVLPKYRAAVFVHGCFWHLHECHNFKWPSSRPDFWRNKLTKNRRRDERVVSALESTGWRVFVVWECETRENLAAVVERLSEWLSRASAPVVS